MNLPTEIFGDVIVVHAPEELCEEQSEQFQGHVTSLERTRVILDLDSTEAINSWGLEALLESQEILRALDGDLKIATTIHANRKILEITRLDQQLELFDSVIDAVKSFA